MSTLISTFTFGGMNNVSDPVNVGIPAESARVQDRAYTQCTDIVNCDVDDDMNVLRRDGSELITEGAVTSSWSNGTDAYCIVDGAINVFDGAQLTPLAGSPTLADQVEFCQVNDIVVFSDNATIGCIENGEVTVFNIPSEVTDLLDLENWVKRTYPGSDAPEIDAFKIATLAGRCLEFFNGRLYLAIDNFIFCTKTFDVEHMDQRYNVVAGFSAPVTMIKHVADGLYVGTEKATYFLSGMGPVHDEATGNMVRSFEERRLLPFGTVYGSALSVPVPADKITPLKAEDTAVVWLTPDGVYAGAAGGRYVDLTAKQMYMPETDSACAMVRQVGEAWQYVVCPEDPDLNTVVVNLNNSAHSRYENFSFGGLFKRDGRHYGTNALGVFLLEGDLDYGAQDIDASLTTPLADLGVPQIKRVSDAYLHARTSGALSVDLVVDEQELATYLPFSAPFKVSDGVRRFRAKLPRGAKGTNWQFRVSNVDGCRFTAFSLKITPTVSGRTV